MSEEAIVFEAVGVLTEVCRASTILEDRLASGGGGPALSSEAL